jgi:hypothetical protein
MTTNEFAADDSWSSLARELGLGDEPAASPVSAQSSAEILEPHLSELPDADDGEDTAIEPGLTTEAGGDSGEGDEPGEDGKRRRRRRRRRRKGGSAEPGDAEAMIEGADESDDPAEDAPTSGETPANVALHDVVANWNVPSWDELIGGLYRPGN